MTDFSVWDDPSPQGYRHRAMLIAECALGIGNGQQNFAITEIEAEGECNPAVVDAMWRFGVRHAVKMAAERQQRIDRAALRKLNRKQRQELSAKILAAQEAEKQRRKHERAVRVQRLIEERRALPLSAMLPDYSGENLGVAS